MALEERLKQRLIGAAVLVALVVIFVPMLIDEPVDSKLVSDHSIPEKAPVSSQPMSEILPPLPKEERAGDATASTEAPPVKPPPPEPLSGDSKRENERKSPSAWIIQVASLTVRKNAQNLVADLKKSKLPAQVDEVVVDGKKHYRVRVGPEVDFKTAERMVEQIKRDFKLKPRVMRYPE